MAFDQLGLIPALEAGLQDLGYEQMTMVQAQALPDVLNKKDVIAQARTGSGKTVAFGLGILQHLDTKSFRIQSLVLCPTRELAEQVATHLRDLARRIGNVKVLTLCGGVSIGPQIGSLKHSAHIVVGTPGRVLKHLSKKTVRFNGITSLVLDEADRMLDMGFADEIDAIIKQLPVQRQTLLFSATFPEQIMQMSNRAQKNAKLIDVTDLQAPVDVAQYWLKTNRATREADLVRALQAWGGESNLVFCNTKIDCGTLLEYLQSKNIPAVALHGDLEQKERTEALVRFANRSTTVMVATDVAARGLDIKALDAVFNYELPNQPEVYVHRIGRTGRANESGVAVSLVAPRELQRLQDISMVIPNLVEEQFSTLARTDDHRLAATMRTIEVNGGRKHKLRAGDLLGALTAQKNIPGDAVGKIDVFEIVTYVAVSREYAKEAVRLLNNKIKGRSFRARFAGS